ncbi:MAG: hypothetical protein LBS85_04580 [Clostridiales Family XIII bacterium]|jgi:hypothetical protein|nr:hypothetical protein [Clostridiales Family XIII bacterium]
MPLIILGLIVVVGAMLLIFSSFSIGKSKKKAARTSAIPEEPLYETSDDGKVIYLFGSEPRAQDAETGRKKEEETGGEPHE